ncbi:hypothetical protein BA190_07255 [Labrys sp. WJW]|uniref:hypothetical protein n=1 Tax=Labrys sp. WJW TaxID=1737983 RepID=UPI0008298AAD|nr:hypothetical protein [Labrys sp. WJW]OCC05737.1 hypothetical protein BA190_07255 [Labrys sp. WJW]
MQKNVTDIEAVAPSQDHQSKSEVASAPNPAPAKAGLHSDNVFDRLVHDEEDVVGLLAFSLSMQNKRDWLAAFKKEVGRDPTPQELAAYDIGERIDRRLATYRKLAEHALAGNSFWASATLTPVSELPGPSVSESSSVPAKPQRSSWFSGSKG